jgi:signal peptidase I
MENPPIAPTNPEQQLPKYYKRRIWIVILLNILNPGLSFIYNGNLRSGLIVAGIFAFSNTLIIPFGLFSFYLFVIMFGLYIGINIWLLIYNVRKTIKNNSIGNSPTRLVWLKISAVLIGVIILSRISSTLLEEHFIEAYKISAGDMENTIFVGDYFLADKNIEPSLLQRGDIIVFKYPFDIDQNYIKRIIGLAGDTIKIENKQVLINNRPITCPAGIRFSDPYHIIPYSDKGRWLTTKDGQDHWYNIGSRDNMPEIIVPQSRLFVMGDNRDYSADSRYWGCLDQNLVLGKALFIHFSWDYIHHHILWQRIGKRLDQDS